MNVTGAQGFGRSGYKRRGLWGRRAPGLLYASLLVAGTAWAAVPDWQIAATSQASQATGRNPAPAALPDSPGTLLSQVAASQAVPQSTEKPSGSKDDNATRPASSLPPCVQSGETTDSTRANDPPTPAGAKPVSPANSPSGRFSVSASPSQPCPEKQVQPILSARRSHPLSSKQKGELAVRDTIDPFNLMTIALYSGFAVVFNAHSAYGPGFKGWGKLSGYSLVEDAQGEFFGTFLVSSLAHEDPRYHRMPNAPVKKRILHAISHTWVSQHDDGRPMPNYSTLLTYPFSAELSNLYVPGVPTNLHDTGERVAIGLATDPTGTLVAEFLPDVAKRIHIHVIFIQEILNQVITGGTAPNVQ